MIGFAEIIQETDSFNPAGMTLQDLGIRIFTFVFGQARHQGRVALVSLARLKPEFYGLASDSDLTLRRAVTEYGLHYHMERNHQGLENELVIRSETTAAATGPVACHERLGGLLRHYYREAA